MKTIEQEFEEFRKQVIDHEAPEIQVESMRVAFVAGATTSFTKTASATNQEKQKIWDDLEGENKKIIAGLYSKYGVLKA